jgi:hypothetical protein
MKTMRGAATCEPGGGAALARRWAAPDLII